MLAALAELHPIMQAFLATCFTWAVTSLGASAVFLAQQPSRKLLDGMLGFAAGVMIAASYWSLLAPSITMSEEMGYVAWVPPAIGFLAGGLFLRGLDYILPHLHRGLPRSAAEGPPTDLPRSTLFVLAVTLHNIPEGLAVGVAFGAVAAGLPAATMAGAVALACLQQFLQSQPDSACGARQRKNQRQTDPGTLRLRVTGTGQRNF